MMFLNFCAPFEERADELFEYSEKIGAFEIFGASEKQRLLNIRDERARALSLGGIIALKETLDKLDLCGSAILRKNGGKPEFQSAETGSFSISHSGEVAVSLYSKDCDVGVDVEKMNSSRDVRGIADRFFSCDEIKYLEERDYSIEAFYKIWTAKESIAKLKGEALSDILKGLNVLKVSEEYKLAHFRLCYNEETYVICACGEELTEIISEIGNIEVLNL